MAGGVFVLMHDPTSSFYERQRDEFVVSDDPARLDLDFIHRSLAEETYWARGIPRSVVERAVRHSLCFGLYGAAGQVGMARVITDRATFAYLCDVFIAKDCRGRGLGVWLVECILAHPDLQGLRRFSLLTKDAHELYRRFGFHKPDEPDNYMEIRWRDVYGQENWRTAGRQPT
jgi:N-acetylglutamate synthase-like GNAT family acetyltransferase